MAAPATAIVPGSGTSSRKPRISPVPTAKLWMFQYAFPAAIPRQQCSFGAGDGAAVCSYVRGIVRTCQCQVERVGITSENNARGKARESGSTGGHTRIYDDSAAVDVRRGHVPGQPGERHIQRHRVGNVVDDNGSVSCSRRSVCRRLICSRHIDDVGYSPAEGQRGEGAELRPGLR